jgi:serine/threonine protein kinase
MEVNELDLKQLIKFSRSSGLKEEHLKIIAYNTLCALKFLHSANIIHRDIKPSNILVNKNCQVMVCDFGLSRSMPESVVGKGSCNSKRWRDSLI